MVGGYSYEVDGDYFDLVHYYDPESKSIIPLEGRLQTKKGVIYYNCIILMTCFKIWIQFDLFQEVAALLVNRSIFPECNSH